MKIADILKKDFIIVDLQSTDKEGVLLEMTRFLEQKGKIKGQVTLQSTLMERERLGSTGIG